MLDQRRASFEASLREAPQLEPDISADRLAMRRKVRRRICKAA
jgi:hypothetical protein